VPSRAGWPSRHRLVPAQDDIHIGVIGVILIILIVLLLLGRL
jgi:hypothetical protein